MAVVVQGGCSLPGNARSARLARLLPLRKLHGLARHFRTTACVRMGIFNVDCSQPTYLL